MKKTFCLLGMTLLAVVLCVSVSSCSKDDEVICPCSCCCSSGSSSESDSDKSGDSDKSDDSDKPDLIDGGFSVSPSKTVEFTKGNLYWDGTDFHFEANQNDFPTATWNSNHVGHLMWTNSKDFQFGNSLYKPYAEHLRSHGIDTSDKFFCGEDNPLTVDSISGCFALSVDEWLYLINKRPKATNLRKFEVSVGGTAHCLIIAPDDFRDSLKDSYTLDELDSLGLVCLPAIGFRYGTRIETDTAPFGYWSSTPVSDYLDGAYHIIFPSSTSCIGFDVSRSTGLAIRLVRLPQ